jgi:hypothetical protein
MAGDHRVILNEFCPRISGEETTVVEQRIDALSWLRKRLEEEHPDLLREMVESFAEQLMSAEADAICGAAYGERSSQRVNTRNGYRDREWDTRAGTIELAIPQAAGGQLLSRLAVGAQAARGAGVGVGGGRLLPGWRVDAAGGEAGLPAWDRPDE